MQPVHRVLIAADDRDLLIEITAALQGHPLVGALAGSRAELLAPGCSAEFDMAIIDESLGAYDSWGVSAALRQAAGDRLVVVIGLVQSLDPEQVGRRREYGIDGFLRKSGAAVKLAEGLAIMARNVPPREIVDNSAFAPFAELHRRLLDQPAQEDAPTADFGPAEQSGSTGPASPVPPGSADDLVGVVLGKVRLVRELARGAGGIVFEGLHLNLDLPVAIKVLHPELARADTAYAMSFLREARIAARVAHSNAVRVLDCDRDDATGACFIVMEYVKGRSLEQELQAHGRMSEQRLTGIGIGVALALVAAEDEGVIHRDIKPANIMLHKDDAVKVTDLGLAQPTRALGGLSVNTLESRMKAMERARQKAGDSGGNSMIAGTPWYMAPEQITDPESADVRSDIYSFGATLYHAAWGQPPFPGDDIADVMLHHLHDTAVSLHERDASISEAFSRLVQRMMSKKPEDRPAGPREVLSQLREHRQQLIDEKRWKKANAVSRTLRRMIRPD